MSTGTRRRATATPDASEPVPSGRRALPSSVGTGGENGPHGTAQHEAGPSGGLRGAHPRHRHPRRDAVVVPRVRLLRHLLAGTAGRARRPEARPAPDPLHAQRHGHPPRPRPRQVRPRGRRGDGSAAPPRRRCDLRRSGPDRAAVGDAAADGRRPRQLRLPRRGRPAGSHALHGVPDGAAGGGDDRVDRRGHRRLPAQLRQSRDGAVGAAVGDPQPGGQRHDRHRGRHGDQHGAAQPGGGRAGAAPPDQAPRHRRRRPDALHPRPRPADRRQDRRTRGIRDAYETGRGTFRMRATARVETVGRRKGIVVTELPYGVGTEKVVERIKASSRARSSRASPT